MNLSFHFQQYLSHLLNHLQYIDNQNTTNNMRGKLEAYEFLTSLLKKDVTAEFLNRFKDLFLKYVEPQEELLYGEVY